MVGTILSNFWVALFAFSIYFFSAYPFMEGLSILFNASVMAIIFFVLTFIVRAIIGFVMENPINIEQEMVVVSPDVAAKPEITSEKYAEIVKSLLKDE